MSKNITIQEGGVARTLSGVEKIVTNVAGESGTQNWVPEDEAANYVSTGELDARENGTYISRDDGYAGYSKVEVSVTPNVGELNVSDNGTYYAQNDGYDGFSKVVVDVEGGGGGATLISKEITEDGTYDASDDDADGYSSVTVNVGSGGTLITKQITQNGTYNASDDSANGYSSVTVNVSYPHGSIVVPGMNHVPVSQRISTRDFIEDFDEKLFTIVEPEITDQIFKLRLEQYIRFGGWITDNGLQRMLNYDKLILFGYGGFSNRLPSVQDQCVMWGLYAVGVIDETANVTITNINKDRCDVYEYNGNNFTRNSSEGGQYRSPSNAGYYWEEILRVCDDIDNNTRGTNTEMSVVNFAPYNNWQVLAQNRPYLSLMTNLITT